MLYSVYLCLTNPPFFSSIMLMTLSNKLISETGDEKPILTFIYDYLESRQVLLKTIPVSTLTFLRSFSAALGITLCF
jgi:hypothetical protein